MKRRSLTSALAAVVLGLSVALVPAASASAAGNGSITVYNNCSSTRIVGFYDMHNNFVGVASAIVSVGQRKVVSLPPSLYYVDSYKPFTTTFLGPGINVTVISGRGQAFRLC